MNPVYALKERFFPSNAGYSRREQMGYCAGVFGNSMGQDSVESLSDKFCREYMMIEQNHMTISGFITLFSGLLAGTLSGYILDTPVPDRRKAPSRIITSVMPVPFAVASLLLFLVPGDDPFRNFIWMAVLRALFRFVDSFYDSALNTLSLRMVTRSDDRKSFFSAGTLSSALGSMLPGWLIPIAARRAKNVILERNCYFYGSLVFAVIGVVMMYFPYFTMQEHISVTERPEKQKLVWDKQTVLSLLHNRSFMVLEAATFFEQIRQIAYNLLLYLYDYVLDDIDLKGIMEPVSGTLSYVGLLLVPFLTGRFSPRTVLSGGFGYTGIFYAVMGLFGVRYNTSTIRKKKVLLGLLIAFAGMPNNAISTSKKIVVGDSTDYMEWYAEKHFGRPIHAEGFIAAAQSMFGTLFDLIRTGVYNVWFGMLGFKPAYKDAMGELQKAKQTEATLGGIYRMFVICGVVGNLCAAIAYLFDNYQGEHKEKITAELQEMREKRRQIVKSRSADVRAATE